MLEYANGGDLLGILQRQRRMEAHQVIFYICQIILAIEYLHANQIVFRDLKKRI